MENRTAFKAALRAFACVAAVLPITKSAWAQPIEITEFYDTQRGYTNPVSPEAWSMIKYGDAELNLYTGALGLSIPVYTFKNRNFTLPVSLDYASTGYKPNMQTGVLGAGWYLRAGGVITREVNGIPDESVNAYTYRNKMAGGESDHGNADIGKKTHEMSGYYQLFINPNLQNRCRQDFLYSGVPAQEYVIAYREDVYNQYDDVNDDQYYETEPDLFHYNFMGYTGSFMLQPGEIVVFDCNTPPGEIRIDTYISDGYDGLKGFTITTGDGYEYVFSEADTSKTFGPDTSDDGNWVVSSWTLDSVSSYNGDRITFEYDRSPYSFSCIPNLYYEDEYKRLSQHKDESDPDQNKVQYQQIDVNQVSTCVLAKIVTSEVEIAFDYGKKNSEWWNTRIVSRHIYDDMGEHGKRLNRITVKNLFTDEILKTCNLRYNYDESGTPDERLTLLTSVELSGEGTYAMEYFRQSDPCPPINTFAIDWWGYFNDRNNDAISTTNVSQSKFFPKNSQGVISSNYHYRDPDFESARYGMLRKIRYPTGGYSVIDYEPNDYGRKVVRDNDHTYIPMLHEAAGAAGGVRVRSIMDFPSDDAGNGIYRDFSYKTAAGGSSGILLWEPHVYMEYKIKTSGYEITREYTTTRQSFPFAKSNHLEYERVVEKRYLSNDLRNVSTIEHCFYTSKEYPDQFNPDDYIWESGDFVPEYTPIPALSNARFLFCQVFSRGNMRGKPKSKTYSDNGLPVYTETYTYTDAPLRGFVQVPTSFLCQVSRQRINTASVFPEVTRTTYKTGSANKLTNYVMNTYNRLGQLTRTEQGDSKGNNRVTRTVRSGDVFIGEASAPWTDVPGPKGYPLSQTVHVEKPDSTRIVLSSLRCAYTTVMNDYERNILCLESIRRGVVTPGIHPDSIVYRTEVHNDRFDKCGNVLQSTDKSGMKSCYVWGYEGAYVVARIDNATLEQVLPLLGTDITQRPLSRGLSPAQKEALHAIDGAYATTYDYRPLAGIREICDPSGRVGTFEYDQHGRLIRTRDDRGKPRNEYRYHIVTAQ